MVENSGAYINATAVFWEVVTEMSWLFVFFFGQNYCKRRNGFKDLMKLIGKESSEMWLLSKSSYLNGDFQRCQ